jgi:uncharacterized membrane protein YebE (DUF533 family)
MSTLLELATKLEFDGGEAKRILDDELARKSNCAVLAAQMPTAQRRIEAYAMGCLMGCADGSLDDTERALLAEFAKGAGISDESAEKVLSKMMATAKAAADKQSD